MNLPLNIDIQQVFLHLFNFSILGLGLYVLLFKPVKDFMDKRLAYYQQMDEEAKAALSDAKEKQADYEKQLKEVDKEIAVNRAKAGRDLQKRCDEEINIAKEKANKIIKNAQNEAEREKERILADAQLEIAEMAATATEKLLYRSVTEAFDQFLDGAEGSVVDEQAQ